MRAGRRPITKLICGILCALAALVAMLPAPALADGPSIPITNQYFPDDTLRMILRSPGCDRNMDGTLSSEEVSLITSLDLRNAGIEDLTGIKYLTSLRTLNLSGNLQLPTIDVSGMTELRELRLVGATGTTTLNTTGCTKLEVLDCSASGITTLKISTEDGSQLPSLRKLDCSGCAELTSVIVGNCDAILELYANDCPKLKTFDFRSAGTPVLSTLNVTRCAALEELTVNNAYNLTSVSLFGNTGLLNINVMDNGITSLDATPCVNATEISVAQNPLASLDISTCTKLETLRCNYTDLTSIDLSPFTRLKWFSAPECRLLFVAFSPSAPLSDGVRLMDQKQTYYNCASDENGWLEVDFARIAQTAGFSKFDPAKVRVKTSTWSYDSATGIARCADYSNALGGIDYTYTDCGQVLENTVLLKTYPVVYAWEGAPAGVSLPEDRRTYATMQDALASMSPTPSRGEVVSAAKNGKYGIFRFSGWDGAVDETGADFFGSWSFLPIRDLWSRVFGDNAYDTMQKCVQADGVFRDGRGGTVIVATGDGYWDALAASGLAGCEGAPIVTTPSGQLGAQAKAELQRLAPSKVVVMGGTFAVSDNAYAQIQQACPGAKVSRVFGDKADDTAVKAYEAGSRWGDTCVVATIDGYWDALSIAPYAYARRAPIFLTNMGSKQLSPATLKAIRDGGFTHVVIVGGTGAVPAAVERQLSGRNVTRLYGNNAIDTSAAIARWEVNEQGMTARNMAVATGQGYWDALAGAPLVGEQNSVLVLVNEGQYQAIDAVYAPDNDNVDSAYVLGGTMAVSDKTWAHLHQ